MASATAKLMGMGMSQAAAAAAVGSIMQESSMNPMAVNGSHRGFLQWDTARQAAFARRYGRPMASGTVPEQQETDDQLAFLVQELHSTHLQAAAQMAKARDLMGKTSAFMRYDEIVNDASFAQQFKYAQEAFQLTSARGGGGTSPAARLPTMCTLATFMCTHPPPTRGRTLRRCGWGWRTSRCLICPPKASQL
jgi:hypothetical protein